MIGHVTAMMLLIGATAFASGGAAFDPTSDIPDGMGNTLLLSRSSALEMSSAPTGGLADGVFLFETGYSRKFAMSEFDRVYGAAAFRHGRWTAALSLSQFGKSELYAEKVGRLALACRFDSLAVGLSFSGMQIEFGGSYDNLSSATVGAACGYNTARLKTAVVFENLTTPQLSENSPAMNIVSTLYAEWLGPGPYSITGRVTLEPNEKPQYGAGQKIRLSTRGVFFWGVTSAPITYGGGIGLNYRSYLISVAATYHPRLGLSHTVALAMSRGE